MFSLREDDHLGVAGQAPLLQKWRSSVASALIWLSTWLQPGGDYFRKWHVWSEGYSGGKSLKDHRSPCAPQPVELHMECAGPSTRSVPAVYLALLPMAGCRSLHLRVSQSFLERKIWLRCCSGSSNA